MATAIAADVAPPLSSLQPLWHRTAPRRLVETCPPHDPVRGWTVWQKHLARKKGDCPLFLSPGPVPFVKGQEKGTVLLASVPFASPLQTVRAAHALTALAGQLTPQDWWQLVEQLHNTAREALEQRVDWPAEPQDVLAHQLLAGELPLVLAYLFPELRALRALRDPARDVFSEALAALTDGVGLPHATLMPVFAELFACWTRVRWIGDRLKRGCWSQEAETQYQWLVRNAIRLADGDQRFLLTDRNDEHAAIDVRSLLRTALDLAGDAGDCAAASANSSKLVPDGARFDDDDLPTPSLNSEWSGVAMLATDWSRSAPKLSLAYAADPLRLELALGRSQLLAGEWRFHTTCDGKPVHVVGEWDELCWQTSDDCDLLELGVELSGGLRLERQILLGREDHVLYVADHVHTADGQPHQLTHSIQLPLAPGASWQPEKETRDGLLVVGKNQTAVLPLALHEWRSDPRGGRLELVDGQLVLAQEATGRAVCCPLFFDLKPRRSLKERTWRQLTVAESLAVVPSDLAVGYRAQSGRNQWLVYRALGPSANRTVLGQNIAGEFCAGHFLKTGELEEWIEIEA